MDIKKIIFLTVTAGVILVFSPSVSQAMTFIFGSGLWGDYTGSFNYVDTNSTSATLTIDLNNTSPSANGGYLTAFAFNNPGNSITGATLSATDANFGILGGPSFNNSVSATPYGQFDIGASTSTSFSGGGSPSKGIGVGASGTFTFSLTGTNLDTLSDSSFADTLSVGPGNGQGDQSLTVRFRGFANGQSDNVPGDFAPEPPSLVLFAMALFGGVFLTRKLKFAN